MVHTQLLCVAIHLSHFYCTFSCLCFTFARFFLSLFLILLLLVFPFFDRALFAILSKSRVCYVHFKPPRNQKKKSVIMMNSRDTFRFSSYRYKEREEWERVFRIRVLFFDNQMRNSSGNWVNLSKYRIFFCFFHFDLLHLKPNELFTIIRKKNDKKTQIQRNNKHLLFDLWACVYGVWCGKKNIAKVDENERKNSLDCVCRSFVMFYVWLVLNGVWHFHTNTDALHIRIFRITHICCSHALMIFAIRHRLKHAIPPDKWTLILSFFCG